LGELITGGIAIVAGVVAGVELFMHLPITSEARKMRNTIRQSIAVISSSRISDHWKEKSTQRYSLTIMISSCLLFFYLISILLTFCLIYALSGFFLYGSLEQAISQLFQIKIQLLAVVVGILYGFARKLVVDG
jgi:hypothetical protein